MKSELKLKLHAQNLIHFPLHSIQYYTSLTAGLYMQNHQ